MWLNNRTDKWKDRKGCHIKILKEFSMHVHDYAMCQSAGLLSCIISYCGRNGVQMGSNFSLLVLVPPLLLASPLRYWKRRVLEAIEIKKHTRNTNLDCRLKLDPIWTPFLPPITDDVAQQTCALAHGIIMHMHAKFFQYFHMTSLPVFSFICAVI